MRRLKNPETCAACGAPVEFALDRVWVNGKVQHRAGKCKQKPIREIGDLIQHRETPPYPW